MTALSHHARVRRAGALGTVCMVELHCEDGGGYASSAARDVTRRLLEKGVYARPLGNVVYLMCTPFTDPAACDRMLEKLISVLDSSESE